jgi:hypothetical protein
MIVDILQIKFPENELYTALPNLEFTIAISIAIFRNSFGNLKFFAKSAVIQVLLDSVESDSDLLV